MPGERPILMMDAMAKAILEGRKTVTRRVGPTWAAVQPGTRLWVREAWNVRGLAWGMRPRDAARIAAPDAWVYRSTPPERWSGGWKPSIHMPKVASRLTLEVKRVDEERPIVQLAEDGQDRVVWLDLDDYEARREGFGSFEEFDAAWQSMHADHTGPVYRVEFREVA